MRRARAYTPKYKRRGYTLEAERAHLVEVAIGGSDSNIVDYKAAGANIYGCQPCPMCGSKYRCTFNKKPDEIVCDDCGFKEPGVDR